MSPKQRKRPGVGTKRRTAKKKEQTSVKRKGRNVHTTRYRLSQQPLVLNAPCDETAPKFELRPIGYNCTCDGTDDKYAPYLELSRRFYMTASSVLDSSDVEFLFTLHKYRPLFTFRTPEFESFKKNTMYVLTVQLKDNPKTAPVFFPVMFRSRLDAYCRSHPDSPVDFDTLAAQETEIDCPLCTYEFNRNIVPNTFKLNGKIQFTTNFMILKEKRKPFVNKQGLMCWFVVKNKYEEDRTDKIENPEDRRAFEELLKIRRFFEAKSYVGHSSIMTTGHVFSKLLGNFLCVVHGKTPCKFKFEKNYKRYTTSLNLGILDSVFGNIRFEQVDGAYCSADNFIDNAYKIANETQKKGFGFLRVKTSYLQVRGDMQSVFGVTKKVAYMSKEVECKEINRRDFGLIAVPDTTDSKNCGLMCQLVPGVTISNRLTCRTNIAELFVNSHAAASSGGRDAVLVDAYCRLWNLVGCTSESILATILSLVNRGIHFDFNMDMDKMVGYVFSFHGALVYYGTGMTAETRRWIESQFPDHFRGEDTKILSYSCFPIPFVNHTNNSKIVGSSKSRQQEIDYPFDPEVAPIYSQPVKTFLNYPNRALNDKFDVGSIQNVVVSICCLGAHNVEEGILINKEAVERGLFSTSEYKRIPFIFQRKYDRTPVRIFNVRKGRVLKPHQMLFEVVGVDVCTQYSNDMKVSARPNGFAITYNGTFERKVWVVDGYEMRCVEMQNCERITVVMLIRTVNYCCEGDKLTTLHAQKGIVSRLMPSVDFPFFQSGMIPDMLLNIGYYDRMTLGQDLDGAAGTKAAEAKKAFDCLFNGESVFELDADEALGEEICETLYDGATGEMLGPAKIHILPYRRLRQEADQVMQSTIGDVQKRDVTTSQYQKGKCNKGGASIGTMENVNVYSIGSKSYSKKLTDLSSGFFENPMDPHIGRVNRTASSINRILMLHGMYYDFDVGIGTLQDDAEDDGTEIASRRGITGGAAAARKRNVVASPIQNKKRNVGNRTK